MPNKHNDARRHRIPKMKFKVTNWSAYEAGLRRRGSMTLWVSDEAITAWRAAPRTTPGGQARYSETAIETALMVRLVFHQPLRQTEGLLGSLLELMGIDLPVPDHACQRCSASTPRCRSLNCPTVSGALLKDPLIYYFAMLGKRLGMRQTRA